MSFLDRSVPLKYAILFAVALTVYVSLATSALHNRQKVRHDYGAMLPAKVIKAGKPRTGGCFLGIGCTTYTKTVVEVNVPSGPWDYSNVTLDGRLNIGHKVQAWFDKGNSNYAYFANEFDPSEGINYSAPWDSIAIVLLRPLLYVSWGCAGVIFLLDRLKLWSRRRENKLRRKPAAV